MAEYVERTEALEITTRTCGDYAAAWSEIRKLPAADVVSVVHGSWVPFHSQAAGDIQYCSACEIGFAARMKYCPHCGARMDAPSNLAELEDAERSRRIKALHVKGVTGG